MPITLSITLKAMNATGKVQAKAARTPTACTQSWPMPPPKNSPSTPPYWAEANSPTASVPQAPTTPWAEITPTGSSILKILSRARTENTTRMPPIRPMIIAMPGLTFAVPAVMATSPAMAPLIAIVTSKRLNRT